MHVVNTDNMWRTTRHEDALETFPRLDHAPAIMQKESGLWNTFATAAQQSGFAHAATSAAVNYMTGSPQMITSQPDKPYTGNAGRPNMMALTY